MAIKEATIGEGREAASCLAVGRALTRSGVEGLRHAPLYRHRDGKRPHKRSVAICSLHSDK